MFLQVIVAAFYFYLNHIMLLGLPRLSSFFSFKNLDYLFHLTLIHSLVSCGMKQLLCSLIITLTNYKNAGRELVDFGFSTPIF